MKAISTPHRTLEDKLDGLRSILIELGEVVIAYSGGVDSTFLLKVAVDTLGERAIGLTAISPSYPEWELKEARSLAAEMGAQMVEVHTHEMKRQAYRENNADRCYHCKTELFDMAQARAIELGLGQVCYGAITDDLGDYRPGMDAASERGIRAPLIEAGFSKDDIRIVSRRMKLSTWDKPATPCLSSRLPYGTTVTPERLDQIGRCEQRLRLMGFKELRARYYDDMVRLEFGREEMAKICGSETLRSSVVEECKAVGFKFVAMDLEGYRTGSGNAALVQIN